MTIKGRLLSSTAPVKRFQNENYLKSTRVTASSSRWNFTTICGDGKLVRLPGRKKEKKFDDIFIRFDTIPACDGLEMTAIAARCRASRGLKRSEG